MGRCLTCGHSWVAGEKAREHLTYKQSTMTAFLLNLHVALSILATGIG